MKASAFSLFFARQSRKLNWPLLLFLLLLVDVKIVVKLAAIVFIYIIRPDFRFGLFRKKLPLFYLLMPLIGVLNYCLYIGSAQEHYTIACLTGIAFWILCLLIVHQLRLAAETISPEILHRTIQVFFLLNLLFSFGKLAMIIIETGEWNPYTYQGMYQKYFIGTGDYIKGISFDTSTTNAVINLLGVLYFLFRKSYWYVIACMAALLLTGSNFVNLVTGSVFVYCFFFNSSREQKSIMVVCMAMLAVFLARISPQNTDYAIKAVAKIFHRQQPPPTATVFIPIELRPDSVLSSDEKKYKLAKHYLDSEILARSIESVKHKNSDEIAEPVSRPSLPVANIHSAPYQHKRDSSATRLQMVAFAQQIGRDTSIAEEKIIAAKTPGKFLAARETCHYFSLHPAQVFNGTGMGNFSSKLAFRITGLQVAGGYPAKYIYINDAFLHNHLAILIDYFDKDSGFHSITNTPNSAYLQMFSEYGLLGVAAFFVFYAGFFWRRIRVNTYAVPILLALLAVLSVDYWFEQLSVIPLFELLLFMNIQKNTKHIEA